MPETPPKYTWEQRLHEAGARVEEDVRKLIDYFNDEVIPDVRKNGSDALRAAAQELNRLAQRMDERAGRKPPSSPSQGEAKKP